MAAAKRRLSPLYESSKTETLSDEKPAPAKKKSWGFHLLVVMRGCNKEMDNITDIRGFFTALIRELKMKELTPFIYRRVNSEEGRGISAFQMIQTSHISAHFDDAMDRGFIDVFSCKPFDEKAAIALIKRYFNPKRFASKFIYRDA